MRGSPLLRALLAFGIILLLGLPISRLTRKATAETAPTAPAPKASEPREITIAVTFISLPTRLRVRHLGKEIWATEPTSPEVEQKVSIPFPAEGVDLEFEAKFPEGAPFTAMRIRLTDPDGDEHERSCWGQGEIDEVLTFP